MKAAPGKGRWRLPGRGRRLPCDVKPWWSFYRGFRHNFSHQCRWCGTRKMRYIDAVMP